MNHEGYRDDTPEKAIWGIRKEERIREIEKNRYRKIMKIN